MIKFYITDEQEKKLNEWLDKIRHRPKAKNEPLKYIFYSVGGIGQCQEVEKGPYKLDLTDVNEW